VLTLPEAFEPLAAEKVEPIPPLLLTAWLRCGCYEEVE
jgi:hypothetical protein